MSVFDILTRLECVWLNEDARLESQLNEIKSNILRCGFNRDNVIDYIVAQAKRDYFKDYIFDIINYLKMFE